MWFIRPIFASYYGERNSIPLQIYLIPLTDIFDPLTDLLDLLTDLLDLRTDLLELASPCDRSHYSST